MSKRLAPSSNDKRQSYPLPQEQVVMLEALLGQALQQNQPVKAGLEALSIRLKMRGAYTIRLTATFVPAFEAAKSEA